ncbi:inorganic phosphate transporter [Anatilimnocola floriformis]|uniref:inorganic phosphate transporter n=1 Tax=Anatilimnocola floriformis TaxID=2948575 RepID=UPI0020C38F5F|nr:inorganic phosphate transporter [Anatilimnocola floriformis]
MLTVLLFIAVCFVAFTNGANANFKGVASLYGSGTTSLRGALYWGTAMTFAGSIAALFLAQGLLDYWGFHSQELLKQFGGIGIVDKEIAQQQEFLTAVALGAALTSFLATRFGFPVSTTHALVGALVGAGLAGSGNLMHSKVHFDAVIWRFVVPLISSPAISALLGALLYGLVKMPKKRNSLLDRLHYLSAGAASFARGLNDTPKMVALLLVISNFDSRWAFIIVAVCIALGGLLDAKNVAETLGKKVTDLDPGQGFAASLVTAGLVTTASLHSYPVSTTHVSVGSLMGIGTITGQAHWRKVIEILIAWITTVPCAAVLAAVAYGLISLF